MAFFEEINTKEELYDILTSIYDVEEKTALIIVENLGSRHRLSESEEILLLSHEIPQEFLDYIQNNKNLNRIKSTMENNMSYRISLNKSKREYDLILKKLENRNYAFRKDKYNVYFAPSIFNKEVVSTMSKSDYKSYGSGAGGELKEHVNKKGEITPASMSSVGSSSRFCYLSLRNSDLLPFGITKNNKNIRFEEKLHISGVEGGIPPHMDAFYENEGNYYFFECKCHEQFDNHELKLSDSYFDKNLIVDKIDKSFFIQNIHKANKKTGKTSIYREYSPEAFGLPSNPRFDIKQFITHIMGIESKIKSEIEKGIKIKDVKLIYFYFIPDLALKNDNIRKVISTLFSEVRIAFASLKNICSTDIKFELYVQYSDKVETASKNNVRKEI